MMHELEFIDIKRKTPINEPVEKRLKHFKEFKTSLDDSTAKSQAARCMDCGTPFCHSGCPIGNMIPEWNALVREEDYETAWKRLELTNNFPEITGRICPAPCESSCVLGINAPAVSIKSIEHKIADVALENGWIKPKPPSKKLGTKIAIVGSGPAGLTAAQQLARMGHDVDVFERNTSIGGLMTYGIPSFKLSKDLIDARFSQMKEEGVRFFTNFEIGKDESLQSLKNRFDAVVIAVGANKPRKLVINDAWNDKVTHENLPTYGIISADQFLKEQIELLREEKSKLSVSAKDKHVIVIGGGDTGSDCIGTSLRQGAVSVVQFEILPMPPELGAHPTAEDRPKNSQWPGPIHMLKESTSQEEGCERYWQISSESILRDSSGKISGIETYEVRWEIEDGKKTLQKLEDKKKVFPADLVVYAVGYDGFDQNLLKGTTLSANENGFLGNGKDLQLEGNLFIAGDIKRGPSLVVWAIEEGRRVAQLVDQYLHKK